MLCGLALTNGKVEGFDFALSAGRLAANAIIDSSTSPPGRYVLEVARRMLKAAPLADSFVIANPLLPLKAAQVVEWLQGGVAVPSVLSDERKFPLLYIVPRDLIEAHGRFLLLLSGSDADLDARLLQGVGGRDCRWKQTGLKKIGDYPLSTPMGWFQGKDRQQAVKALTMNAIRLIEEPGGRWKTLPFAIYHPYHAGSIVFFAAAARAVQTPLYQRQVVCSTYRDIWAAAQSPLEPVWLKLPWLPRDNSVGEPQYFFHALNRLGEAVTRENFLTFNRYSRVSGTNSFHRIDHDRFALGDSLEDPAATSQLQPPLVQGRCALPPAPLKVLFHLSGGLPIKSYPADFLMALLRGLQALGVEPSVIDRFDIPGVRGVIADDAELLAEAVSAHHIFVGLDSFPHHFVRNVMGWPTIGLFGATTAANFGGGWSDQYRTLDANLPCCPCGGEKKCPMFGTPECANYAAPEQVIAAIVTMGRQLYSFGEPL
jgi:hypothetical protein